MRRPAFVLAFLAALLLAGCDMLGIESPEKTAAAREADGKAIGGACRHAGRAIEDCYAIYRKSDRAAIFAGWRDMNDYMRENKIEPVAPQLPTQMASAKLAEPKVAEPRVGAENKPAEGGDEAAADKRPAAKTKPKDVKLHGT
ncbi:MAG TPA: hypothetical protein VF319_08955 [Caldimonas sp.]